jgi:hypothetical protein
MTKKPPSPNWDLPITTGQFHSLQLAVDLIGQHCLNRPMNCLGDTQDADYQAGPTITPYDNTVIAVVGTLGKATGNAIYSALSVNWLKYLKGVANISDPDLQGSASRYSGAVLGARLHRADQLLQDHGGNGPQGRSYQAHSAQLRRAGISAGG